jgi:hypothetical protein
MLRLSVGASYTCLSLPALQAELMQQQLGWVFENGFEVIETEVLQPNHDMQQRNEASGFKAAGIRFGKAEARIIYRKYKQ